MDVACCGVLFKNTDDNCLCRSRDPAVHQLLPTPIRQNTLRAYQSNPKWLPGAFSAACRQEITLKGGKQVTSLQISHKNADAHLPQHDNHRKLVPPNTVTQVHSANDSHSHQVGQNTPYRSLVV